MSAKAAPESKAAQTPESKPARSFTAAPKPLLLRKCACGSSSGGGECEDCAKARLPLQRRATGHDHGGDIPPIVNDVLASPGRPLDAPTRDFMESRFGHDFGDVRIHDDGPAAESAHTVNAHAYTVGQDIAFASGKYDPHSESGKHLLAHELAHTVQQRGLQRSAVDGVSLSSGAEYARLEHDADAAASAVMSGGAVALHRSATSPLLSRAAATEKVTPPKSKKSKVKQSKSGKHKVTPTEGFEARGGKVEEFEVDVFYLPPVKGPAAKSEYEAIAGQKLETVVALNGSGRTKTALWQKREPTDELRARWLGKLGWTDASKDDLWKRAGGDAEFPKVRGATCQMDHIVELQLGGDNTNENIQPLEAEPNRKSGGDIRTQLESLAVAVAEDSELANDDITEVKLRFGAVKLAPGAVQSVTAKCPPTKAQATCLTVERCAKELKLEKDESGAVAIAREDYPVSVGGGSPRNLRVPNTFKASKKEVVPIEGDSLNDPAATLIAGLLLTTLQHPAKGKTDFIVARIDDRPATRLPISLDSKNDPLKLNVGADGKLTIHPSDKNPGLNFTYKYLSPGRITKLEQNDSGGVDWAGYINSRIPFLGRMDVAYSKGELKVTKGIDPETLKKKRVLGARITRAELNLFLAPEFKPEGVLEFELGKQLATGILTVTKDDAGLVAKGKLKLAIPKIDTAETDITYRAGEGRDEWEALINIQSSQIKLPYVTSGSLTGRIAKNALDFEGKVQLALPGNRGTAEVGLEYGSNAWVFVGKGTFNFPKLDETKVKVKYYPTSERLIAEGSTGFTLKAINLTGKLTDVTFTASKGGNVSVSGTGKLSIQRGKAKGSAEVTLHPNGKFTGKGAITYQLRPDLVVEGLVELDEKEKLHIKGVLTFARFKLFDGYHPKPKNLFSLNLSIPVPGASIGGFGLKFKLGGGVDVGYGFGPGVIEPMIFDAGFDPLEEDPDLSVGVTGKLKIPAFAELKAFIKGGLSLDVLIAEAGGELELRGTIRLEGGLFADFKAHYAKNKFTAELTPEISAELILLLALLARVYAEAGVWRLKVRTEKTWTLGERRVPTGLGFLLSAPFSYDSDTGIKLPSPDQITLKKPEISTDKLTEIAKRLFSSAKEETKES